jgi:hypothetical protein
MIAIQSRKFKQPLFEKSGAKTFALCWVMGVVTDNAHDPA